MIQKKLNAKAILLDLDGTVVNSQDAYLDAARTAFQTMGLEPPTLQTALQIPKRLEQRLPIDYLPYAYITRFLNVYFEAFYAVTHAKTKPIPNIRASLEILQKKAKLALITMRDVPKSAVEKELQQFGLSEYFTCILTSQDTCKPKPSPEAHIKALELMDVQICDCLIVGDSILDVTAGKTAGAKTIGVLSGLYTQQELAKVYPDLILKDATRLPSCIS